MLATYLPGKGWLIKTQHQAEEISLQAVGFHNRFGADAVFRIVDARAAIHPVKRAVPPLFGVSLWFYGINGMRVLLRRAAYNTLNRFHQRTVFLRLWYALASPEEKVLADLMWSFPKYPPCATHEESLWLDNYAYSDASCWPLHHDVDQLPFWNPTGPSATDLIAAQGKWIDAIRAKAQTC